MRAGKEGFRPLAGFWFLKGPRRVRGELGRLDWFPSPCGVLVLKGGIANEDIEPDA